MSGERQEPLEIPVHFHPEEDGGQSGKEGETMPEGTGGLARELMSQSMGTLSQSGVVAQNNFITVNKALDYDFMENRRMITLDEAVGVREVSSKSVPAGPTAQ